MRATSLLREVVPFPRLSIRRVSIDESGAVIVGVAVRGKPRCPECGRKCPGYDTNERSRWRHLDLGNRRCFLEAQLQRVECKRCGVRTQAVTWAEPGARFTTDFEELVAWLAQRCDKTTVSRLTRIAWRTVGRIIERVVARRREPLDASRLRVIGVDELSYRKSYYYLTLVTNVEQGRFIWGADGRSAETLDRFFEEIGAEARERIAYATIDMSASYEKSIRANLPNAEIVYDRFHVQRLVSDAVDETRREEWRTTKGTPEGDAIKGTRYALLKNPWNLTLTQEQSLATLQQTNKRLYRAYLLKEFFASIYDRVSTHGWARRRMKQWLAWASRSKLRAFVKLARTIRKHLEGILLYFSTGFTNGPAEGLNAKARLATRQAYGFHSAAAALAIIELRCTGIEIPLPFV